MEDENMLIWKGIKLVRISSVPGFGEWLYGQTIPLVEDDPNPTDWAYYWDYQNFKRKGRITD